MQIKSCNNPGLPGKNLCEIDIPLFAGRISDSSQRKVAFYISLMTRTMQPAIHHFTCRHGTLRYILSHLDTAKFLLNSFGAGVKAIVPEFYLTHRHIMTVFGS